MNGRFLFPVRIVEYTGSIPLTHCCFISPSAKTEAEVLEALDCLRDQPWPLDRRRVTRQGLKAKLVREVEGEMR